MSPKKERKDPAYIREQGARSAKGVKKRNLTFSFIKQIPTQGQTIEEWDKLGLLQKLFLRMKYIGQFSVHAAINDGCIKQYSKVDFPPDSGFKAPKHIHNVTWAVMHVTNKSKEVVAGYIEDDVFYIVFLDKDHEFWPSPLKNT